MRTDTANGLIGANAYLQETRVPMKVYKEARAEGDTAKMERAMGYVEKLGSAAIGHKKQADKGLKEEAKQARAEAEENREELAQRIKERRTETQERIEEARNPEEAENTAAENNPESKPVSESTVNLTYTKDGEVREQSGEAEFTAVV